MHQLLGLLFFVSIALFVLWFNKRYVDQWRHTVGRVGEALGIPFDEGSFLRKAWAEGEVDGLHVRIDSVQRGGGRRSQPSSRIVVSGLPESLDIRPAGLRQALFGEADFQVGDEDFDEQVSLHGSPLELAPLLRARVRAAALDPITEQGATLSEGRLQWVHYGLVRDPQRILALTRSLVALAQGLSEGGDDPAGRLLDIARSEPPAQRARALLLLAQQRHDQQDARPLFEQARDASGPPLLRLAGAAGLRDAEALVALLDEEPPIRRQALEWLHGLDPLALPQAALPALMADPDEPTARLATLIAAAHGPAAEAILIDQLGAERFRLAMLAAEALGRFGSAGAVEPLLLRTTGLLTDPELKQAARAAVASIQARLGVDRPGGLTVAEPEPQGGLALQREEGAVALTAEGTGRRQAQGEPSGGGRHRQ